MKDFLIAVDTSESGLEIQVQKFERLGMKKIGPEMFRVDRFGTERYFQEMSHGT